MNFPKTCVWRIFDNSSLSLIYLSQIIRKSIISRVRETAVVQSRMRLSQNRPARARMLHGCICIEKKTGSRSDLSIPRTCLK